MTKKSKRIISCLVATIAIFIIALTGGSYYFLQYSLYNGERDKNDQAQWDRFNNKYPQLKQWTDSIRNGALHKKWILNADGDSIRIYYLDAPVPTAKTAVLAHGYKGTAISMMHIAYMYNHDMGYNVIAYDQYAHGESAGNMIQMGWKDRKNLIQCTHLANKIYGDSVVLHGISMGGATVMMASGDEQLPEYVYAIVDDCGYTSAWDEFSAQLKDQFGLPEFPFMYTTSAMCKVLQGWSFGEANALNMVEKTNTPMLFIHGGNDDFVPTEMVYEVYKAHHGKKALWIAHGSEHAKSYKDHPKEYTEHVRDFLRQLMI